MNLVFISHVKLYNRYIYRSDIFHAKSCVTRYNISFLISVVLVGLWKSPFLSLQTIFNAVKSILYRDKLNGAKLMSFFGRFSSDLKLAESVTLTSLDLFVPLVIWHFLVSNPPSRRQSININIVLQGAGSILSKLTYISSFCTHVNVYAPCSEQLIAQNKFQSRFVRFFPVRDLFPYAFSSTVNTTLVFQGYDKTSAFYPSQFLNFLVFIARMMRYNILNKNCIKLVIHPRFFYICSIANFFSLLTCRKILFYCNPVGTILASKIISFSPTVSSQVSISSFPASLFRQFSGCLFSFQLVSSHV